MYFDRFDICLAWYHYLAEYHEGQGSEKYARLCKLGRYFSPGAGYPCSRRLIGNARKIYDNLVAKEQGQ